MEKFEDYYKHLGSIVSDRQAEEFYQSINSFACLCDLTGEQQATIAALMTAAVEDSLNGKLKDW